MYELLSAQGSGSAIVETVLTLCDAPYRITEAPPWEEGPHIHRLQQLNPLVQVPVLLLPDGTVMTESGAITLYLTEQYPQAGLAPAHDDPKRPAFLRWLFFLTAGVYSTFRFNDFPERWVSAEAAQAELRERVIEARKRMYEQINNMADTPFFLGDRLSVLDLYIAVMRYWRPQLPWFAEHCPRLDAIGRRMESDPRLAPVFARHFPDKD